MTTRLDPTRVHNNGPVPSPTRLRVDPPPGRRARVPELVVGVALMVGFALAAVLWQMSATDKAPALALLAPVTRGQVIKASDIGFVYLASDDQIAHLAPSDSAKVISRVAVGDFPAGTLLTSGSVAPELAIAPNEGVVGLALEPGQIPAAQLRPGDLVNVIAGPTEGAATAATFASQTGLLASRAVVYAVGDLGTQGRRFVSVKLAEPDANRVAAAAERAPVRLVLVTR